MSARDQPEVLGPESPTCWDRVKGAGGWLQGAGAGLLQAIKSAGEQRNLYSELYVPNLLLRPDYL